MTETEVACIEREEQAGLAELGLRLAEAKQLRDHPETSAWTDGLVGCMV